MDEREAIFRKVVVERLSSPDQLDQLLQVLRPRSWMLLAAIGLLLAVGFAWSVSGTVAVTVPASGLLLRPGGITDLAAPGDGRVVSLRDTGEVLAGGATAATLRPRPDLPGAGSAANEPAAAAELEVEVPFAARIVEVLARPGEEVEAGTPLLSFEAADEELRAVLFVAAEVALEARPGMPVRISPVLGGDGPGQRLDGEVLAVASHPATVRGLEALLSDRQLAARLMEQDRRWRIDVELPPEPPAAGSARVPRVSRTEVRGQIVLREERPIHQLLPWLGGGG